MILLCPYGIKYIYNYSDFNEQEHFISQLKQETQELKDGEHACDM